jgi:hypothetical protein
MEIGLALPVDDLTFVFASRSMLASNHLVYLFASFVPVPYVHANLRTPAKVEQAVIAQSTIYHDGTYVVPYTSDVDGLSLTPSKTGLLKGTQRKLELLHLGYIAHWEAFRGVVISKRLFAPR